jgi:uncharacterized protein Yka (UPF0111/DUF47 family)
MPAKTLMVDELGEQALLVPQLLERALAANDHVKFCLTLLQAAQDHARHPDQPVPDLAAERRAAGISSAELDQAVAGSRPAPDGGLIVPGAARLRQLVLDDIAAMRAPLAATGVPQANVFAGRERVLAAALPAFSDDRIPAGAVGAMATIDRDRGDSLHRLVMDMHKALNALQAQIAEETLDGARVWRIDDADRPLVAAFMAGLNRTAPLKFDHPGLGTTATRAGGRLVIQNDIGTTDAHVLVLHVQGLAATLTYTDVHAERAAFFRSLFQPFAVRWDDTRSRRAGSAGFTAEADYYLCVGHFEAKDPAALERYLGYLGSRIVFLIDWNRARKRLRDFLQKGDPVRLLKWAADQNIGHRGFLALGGERLVYDAIEFAQQPPLRYGERLYEVLGGEGAFGFLQFVLRAASEGLLHGRSERLIRDEIRVELARRFHGAQEGLLSLAGDHAVLVFDLATAVDQALMRVGAPAADGLARRTAARARKWEQEADALVTRVRSLIRRLPQRESFPALLDEADDAADGLEEAAFLTTLVAELELPASVLGPVRELAAILVRGAKELVKMIEAATYAHRDGAREDLQDVLEAVDRLVDIEHQTDAAERAVTRVLLLEAPDFRALHLLSSLARVLEEAADALSRSALKLRDHLLDNVMAG